MEPETPDPSTAGDDAQWTAPAADAPTAEPAGDHPDTTAGDAPTAQPTGEGIGEDPQTPPPPPPPPPPGAGPEPGGGVAAPAFQFLRSRHDRKVGGVAGGLAAAADLDPTLARLAIVLGLLTGWGVLAYLIAWAIIPEEDPARGRLLVRAPERTGRHVRIVLTVIGVVGVLHVVGAILGILSAALIGIGLFPAHIFGLNHDAGFQPGEALLGLLLLIGGMLLVFRHHLPWMPAPDTGRPSGRAPSAPTPPASASMALATLTPGSGGGATYGPPPPPPGAAGGSSGSPGWAEFGARASEFGARASAVARSARTNGPLLFVRAIGWMAALWFLIAMIVGGAFWVAGAVHVQLPVLPIVASLAALGLLGYTLVRSRRLGAVIGATALLVVPTGLAAALTRIDGQAGDRSVTPISVSDLEPRYRHSVGSLDLDLSRLQLPPGSRTPLSISMGVGQIEVVVPWDADVESRASVGAGTFDLFGNRQTGLNLNGRTHSTGQPGAPVLVISGKAGAGEIVVRRGYEPFAHEALRTGEPVPVRCSLIPPRPDQPALAASGSLQCLAADGVTQTPPLNCVVAAQGFGLCRPAGEPEPAVDYAGAAGTRHCQVPAGGGVSTCTPPVTGKTAPSGGSFTCTIPEGGGQASCTPAAAGPSDPNAPAPPATTGPADPNAPVTPTTPPPTAAPGEYRCTVPEGGGPATCEPA